MALSLANTKITFAASTDVPLKIVPILAMTPNVVDINASPSAVQAGTDDGKHQIVFTPDNEGQPQIAPIVVNFGSGSVAKTARDTAYAALVTACTSV